MESGDGVDPAEQGVLADSVSLALLVVLEALREIVDAWRAAARGGDFAGLVALLHPDAVLRVDTSGAGSKLVQGAAKVAGQATAVLAFTVADGLIVEIDILADPQRLAALDFAR